MPHSPRASPGFPAKADESSAQTGEVFGRRASCYVISAFAIFAKS
jgi:hypothetical protein